MLGTFAAYFVPRWLLGFTPAATPTTGHRAAILLRLAMLFAMLASGSAAVVAGTRRLPAAAPPQRRPLPFLITAIGASFVIQEFVHFILPTSSRAGGATPNAVILVKPRCSSRSSGSRSIR